MELDALLLSRLQFAFTIAFHIIFPSFTIGLASYLAVLEGLWLKTERSVFRELYFFWSKIFAVSFGMGVVSGVVLSYQIGTNWSRFSELTGNITGPLLSYEVLTAFFLEAGFLGIMLFGWNKVGPKLHFAATLLVAIGTLISAFWILSANSWMQTPTGYELRDGVFFATDWLEVIFNPSFPYRLVHMVLAAYLTTALVVAGVAAWYLVRRSHGEAATIMLKMAIGMLAIVGPLQVLAGHEHGVNTLEHQPRKIAAMEGHWEDYRGAPLILFAVPDPAAETNRYTVEIPKLGSWILTYDFNAPVEGLKSWAEDDRPPVILPFYAFRIMVGIGTLIVIAGWLGAWYWWRGRLTEARWFLQLCRLVSPLGFVAIICGWVVTEVGRQPFLVYGLLRTADGLSPVSASSVGTTFVAFCIVYTIVFCAGALYITRLLRKGPEHGVSMAEETVPMSGRLTVEETAARRNGPEGRRP